jgi:hypothetical protein
MTNTTKEALRQLKAYNPYNENGDVESYNEIYNAMYKLSCFGIISQDEWKKIYTLDDELFKWNLEEK